MQAQEHLLQGKQKEQLSLFFFICKKDIILQILLYPKEDEKAIETMLRSNPGFILLKDSEVLGKWHHSNTDELIQE